MNRSPLVHRLRSNAKIFVVMRAFNISMLDQARGAATLHLLEPFPAKWDTGSREENASKTRIWSSASVLIQSEPKML